MTLFDAAFALIPKKQAIVFSSFPDYTDNAYALYDYIVRQREDIASAYELVWLNGYGSNLPHDFVYHRNTRLLAKKSLPGIVASLRPSYVFHTHGFYSNRITGPIPGCTNICLWHGCGYKTIPISERASYYGDYNTVTSELFGRIYSEIYSFPEDKELAFGLPRNDVLFHKGASREKLGVGDSEKLYLWMPTYRKAAFGHVGEDGVKSSFGLGSLVADDLDRIDAALEMSNATLVIKPHPMDSVELVRSREYARIKVLTTEDLTGRGMCLYQLLSLSDALISDYSSVIVDYLLLDRPVVFALSDLNEFSENRGFVFEDISNYMPGPVVSSTDELVEYFSRPSDFDGAWTEKRRELTHLFHTHIDGGSCERICNYFFGERLSS